MLSERKKKILRAIIDDYVTTAEPVGSKALLKNHSLGVSSATVRNEMSELEDLGYLEKTHTSSGRVPSDKGYRTYIDLLLHLQPLAYQDQAAIESFFRQHATEVGDLVRQSAAVLSAQTNFPAMVISPRYGDSSLEQIKLLMIEPGKVLVVVVLSPGIVKDRLVRLPTELDQADLSLISNLIEHNLSGQKLDQITLITVSAAAEEVPVPENLLNQVLFEAYISIKQAENINFYLEGSHKLLDQPEFQEVKAAQKLMQVIHQEGLVAGYLSEWDSQDGQTMDLQAGPEDQEALTPSRRHLDKKGENPSYMVRIGQEIALDGLEECSFITATYKITNKITGRIGVVGPKRMAYDKIISQINFVNYTLDRQLLALATGTDPEEDKDEQKQAQG